MRSLQISRSTQSHDRLSGPRLSPAPAGFDGTRSAACGTLVPSVGFAPHFSLAPSFTPPPSCPPSLGPVCVARASRRSRGLGTMRALTPAHVTPHAGLAACLVHASRRSVSNHVDGSKVASFARPAPSMCSRLRHNVAGSPPCPRRIEFVFLRTASSLPVAPHPASRRRSYLQLRGSGFPRRGLAPRCMTASTVVPHPGLPPGPRASVTPTIACGAR